MRRATLLILTLLLPVTLIVALLTILQRSRPPAAWQLELDKYVEYKDLFLSEATKVQLIDQASRPWNFNQDMSGAVFGDNPYYRTDYGYSGTERNKGGPRPLPYPPKNVWCALLERDRKAADELMEETTYTVVFVAEHQDLYNASMVIHEAASDLSAQVFVESLSRIGCDSVLEQLQLSNVRH